MQYGGAVLDLHVTSFAEEDPGGGVDCGADGEAAFSDGSLGFLDGELVAFVRGRHGVVGRGERSKNDLGSVNKAS